MPFERWKLKREEMATKRIDSKHARKTFFSSARWRCTVLVAALASAVTAQQRQDPLTMNGGSVLAMSGKECVAVAVDKRFGSGSSLIHIRQRPVLHLPDSTALVAFTGLEADVQSLRVELAAQVAHTYSRGLGFGGVSSRAAGSAATSSISRYGSTAPRLGVSAKAVASVTSHVLYRRKRSPYYVEPLIVGLEPDGWFDPAAKGIVTEGGFGGDDGTDSRGSEAMDTPRVPASMKRRRYRPYLCSMDLIGAKSESEAFVCAGTASQSMYGTAEALWEPDLTADELVAVCGTAFLSALERDCLSGYGATVYLLTPDGIIEYDLTGRSD